MELFSNISPEQQASLDAVIELAHTCEYEETRTNYVTNLALQLFDELQNLHKLGQRERFWLLCAGILHDIGWINGWKGHHKNSLRIILNTPMLPFNNKERLIIGSIARYHRNVLPSLEHDHYAVLEAHEREVVSVLAACLRLADGLDSAHKARVHDLQFEITSKEIVLTCITEEISPEEEIAANSKSDLLRSVFNRKVIIDWKTV